MMTSQQIQYGGLLLVYLLRYTNLYTNNILLAFYIILLCYFIVSDVLIQPLATIRNKPD